MFLANIALFACVDNFVFFPRFGEERLFLDVKERGVTDPIKKKGEVSAEKNYTSRVKIFQIYTHINK